MNYLKKMSTANMNVIPKGYKKPVAEDGTGGMAHGDMLPLFDVVGIAESVETGNTSLGEWMAFGGTFQATACQPDKDGVLQMYRSKKLFLPDVATDAIADALASSEGGKVEFALQIGFKRNIKLDAQGNEIGAGYEYTMKPLIEIDTASDPLAHLNSKVKALAAPVVKVDNEAEKHAAKNGKK